MVWGDMGSLTPLKGRRFWAFPEVEPFSFFTLADSLCHLDSVGRAKGGSSNQSKDEEDKDEDEEGFTRL